MADNNPNIPNIPNAPAGALPPKKETGKVQPKKETVRINLPPKPSAAPTIKLPTLPPGGPAAAPAPAASLSTSAAPSAPRAAAAPVAAPAAPRAAAAPPRSAAAAMPSRPTISAIDTFLAIAAAIVALAAVGTTVWMMLLELPH
jgi:hypothetical protein